MVECLLSAVTVEKPYRISNFSISTRTPCLYGSTVYMCLLRLWNFSCLVCGERREIPIFRLTYLVSPHSLGLRVCM